MSVCGSLYIISLPIGNIEDISLRALRILDEVDIVATKDPRKTQRFLHHYRIRAALTTYDRGSAPEKTPILLEQLRCGKSLALVSGGGTPCIYDPGIRLIAAARRASIPVIAVPGASALVAALAVSGLSGNAVQFYGRIPVGTHSFNRLMTALEDSPCTGVLFVLPSQLRRTLSRMHTAVGNRRVVVAVDLTKTTEQIVSGTIAQVLRKHSLDFHNAEVTLVLAGH